VALGSKPRYGISNGPPINPNMLGGPAGAVTGAVNPPVPAELPFDSYHLGETVTADANGVADIVLGPAPALILVERIIVTSDSLANSTANVYVGEIDPKNLADRTYDGNGDVADETNPPRVQPNQSLRIRWTGATPGAACTASVWYQQQRLS
jgi:hypothetical protein